jgi:hypothetical protein
MSKNVPAKMIAVNASAISFEGWMLLLPAI